MKQPEIEHVKLCDLLIGRAMRLNAARELERALLLESIGGHASEIHYRFGSAEHLEWVASMAEKGRIKFGARHNRCGYQPAEDRPPEWRRSKEWSDVL